MASESTTAHPFEDAPNHVTPTVVHDPILTKTDFKSVGTRPLRPDGLDKVTGRARYGADFNLPGQLVGLVLRSPHAHAKIKKIDTSKAEKLAGVKAVLTAADLPDQVPAGVAAERKDRLMALQQPIAAARNALPQRAQAKVSMLSGGERNRLLLARLFAQPANVLVLDEPTNDLDIESLELLEDTLQSYSGTLLLVSHDRAFLDNVVTQTLVAEGDGRWKEYVGGYSDWLMQRPQPVASVSKPPAEEKPSRSAAPVKARLSFKEQRELAQLPDELDALEKEQAALMARMSGVDYHKQGAAQLKADRERLEEIERQQSAKFERWELLDQRAAQPAGA